jgi:hypothetical protein
MTARLGVIADALTLATRSHPVKARKPPRAPDKTLRAGTPAPSEANDRAIRDRRHLYEKCYMSVSKRGAFHGTIVLDVVVAANGKATKVVVKRPDQLGTCIARAVTRIPFEAKAATFGYSISFSLL